jgi:hypothetical protein
MNNHGRDEQRRRCCTPLLYLTAALSGRPTRRSRARSRVELVHECPPTSTPDRRRSHPSGCPRPWSRLQAGSRAWPSSMLVSVPDRAVLSSGMQVLCHAVGHAGTGARCLPLASFPRGPSEHLAAYRVRSGRASVRSSHVPQRRESPFAGFLQDRLRCRPTAPVPARDGQECAPCSDPNVFYRSCSDCLQSV